MLYASKCSRCRSLLKLASPRRGSFAFVSRGSFRWPYEPSKIVQHIFFYGTHRKRIVAKNSKTFNERDDGVLLYTFTCGRDILENACSSNERVSLRGSDGRHSPKSAFVTILTTISLIAFDIILMRRGRIIFNGTDGAFSPRNISFHKSFH